ncbi:hypothetical protein [Saccharicrinis sp. FJH54]|uniref:hypothetical protein n=1 Tax=Saccharicrinis sp. FJH54 TaxID=3344665 RepID=UPI0035D462A7
MEFNEKIKKELEERIKKLEDIIAKKGVGSKQLKKARKAQRNINLAIIAGSLITITGITAWAISNGRQGD